MLCRNPYVNSDGKAYGCGQCMPCRVNRRRKWQARIMLEAAQYVDNTFLTLTYDDTCLPRTESGLGNLSPKDLRGFLDRLRYHFGTVGRRGVRFYAVGEYGDETERPHYHLALFNVPNCSFGMSVYSKVRRTCCPTCELYRSIWGKGHIFCGSLERDSAGYVSGYLTKKMTRSDDERLIDRYPEFCRMSRMPGIGASAMWDVADILLRYDLVDTRLGGDVPLQLGEGKRKIPLDRYLRKKLRTYVGRDEKAPDFVIDQMAEEMQALRKRAEAATTDPSGRRRYYKEILKGMILDDGDADYATWNSRRRIFNRKRSAI